MMKHSVVLSAVLIIWASFPSAQSQPVPTSTSLVQGFESENAILDTSIPFVSGAREARQELRGSFGWSTFQEGQIQGIYFRFDPDGYARFSTTPRLDTDVFEVICRPRTLSCMGRKAGMSVSLTPAGQLQIGVENRVAGDRFFLSEGLSEVQLPDRILQPLDPQLEALVSTGGELIVRRGDQIAGRFSLNGFFPVAAYLRWIVARQDYGVLPRNWPVPNATTLTAANPVPLPQAVAPIAEAFDPLLNTGQPAGRVNEVAEVRGELDMLRQMLLEQSSNNNPVNPAPEAMDTPVPSDTRLSELERSNQMLMHELQRLRSMQSLQAPPAMQNKPMHEVAPIAPSRGQNVLAQETAERLEYLMSEIGLDAKTALLLIQSGQDGASGARTTEDTAYQDALVTDILDELRDQMPDLSDASPRATAFTREEIPPDEFVLLSEYFKSVMAGQ